MKRRVAGAALFGFGLLCLIAAACMAWVIVPMNRQIPYDLVPPNVVLVAHNATFLDAERPASGAPRVGVEHADIKATMAVIPDVPAAATLTGPLRDRAVIWNVYQTVNRMDNGDQINSSESRIALDRRTGAAVDWDGQCYNDLPEEEGEELCTPGNITFAGQLYTFPFGTQKKTYTYWDGAVGKALPILYRGTETFNGLSIYRFEQVIPRQDISMNATQLKAVLGMLAPKAKSGSVSYQSTRTLWVEPMTGAIVNYREEHHRQLIPDVGSPITMLDASLEYDAATQQVVRQQTVDGRRTLLVMGRYVPIGLSVVGVIALLWGFLLALAGSRTRRHEVVPSPPPRVPAEAQTA